MAAACCLLPFRAFHAFASKQELHDFLVIFRQAACSCSSSSCLINLECLFNFVCSIAAFFVLICRQKNCSNRFTIFFLPGKTPLGNLANCVAIHCSLRLIIVFRCCCCCACKVVAVAAGVVQLAGSCVVVSLFVLFQLVVFCFFFRSPLLLSLILYQD